MSGGQGPAAGPGDPSDSSIIKRLARLEESHRRLQFTLVAAAAGALVAVVAFFLGIERRHLDTIYARRFVVETSGKVRAELGVDEKDWTAFKLMGEHGVPGLSAGVPPGGGAQLNVESGDGRRITLIGSTIALSAGNVVNAAIEAQSDSGFVIVSRRGAVAWYTPTGVRRVFPR